MSRTFLFVLLVLIPVGAVAQTPPPVARRPVAPAVATSLVLKVTDAVGTALPDVHVTTLAPVAREGLTSRDGSLLFTNMRAKNFINRDPRKDSPLGCTPTGTATLHQLREAWLNHSHADADEWIYVVAGEGTIRIGATDQRVSAGTFTLVPRTVTHALLPSGRNPFIVISVLSGPPCSEF